MIYRKKLEIERSDLLPHALLDGVGEGVNSMLFELALNKCQGQLRAHDGNVASHPKQVGNPADVILVTVR